MLEKELWIGRLAEATQIDYDTSALLWQATCGQLESRLLTHTKVYIPSMGIWALEKRGEKMALYPSGVRKLLPPCLALTISSPQEATDAISILFLCDAISVNTNLSTELVRSYLEQISICWQEFRTSGNSIFWQGIGEFSLFRGEYTLVLAPEFVDAINRPFSMFAPVVLGEEEGFDQLDTVVIEDEEEQYRLIIPSPLTTPHPEEVSEQNKEETNEEIVSSSAQEDETDESSSSISDESSQDDTEETDKITEGNEESENSRQETEVSEPADYTPEATSPKSKKYWLLILVFFIIIGSIFLLRRCSSPQPVTPEVLPQSKVDSLPLQPDTLQTKEVDNPTSSVDTIYIEQGMTLTKYALRKYGHKIFWVYIYEENKDKIVDPNNVPLGTMLILPPAQKYQIDPTDSTALATALDKQRSILGTKTKR